MFAWSSFPSFTLFRVSSFGKLLIMDESEGVTFVELTVRVLLFVEVQAGGDIPLPVDLFYPLKGHVRVEWS